MRLYCLLLVLLMVGCQVARACVDVPVDAVCLPEVSVAGEVPRDNVRNVILVHANGRIELDGATIKEADLIPALRRKSIARAGFIGPDADGVILLRIDARLPWAVAVRIEDSVYETGVTRPFYVVRHCGDDVESAVGIPTPDILRPMIIPSHEQMVASQIEVSVVPNGADRNAIDLLQHLLRIRPGSSAWLDIDGSISTGDALRLIDTAVQAGVKFLHYVPPGYRKRDGSPSFEELMRRPLLRQYSIRVDGVLIQKSSGILPCPGRRAALFELSAPWYLPFDE